MSKQRETLIELLDTIKYPDNMKQAFALKEICYTASETGFIEDLTIDSQLALKIWELVELSKIISIDDLSKIRM